MEPDNEIIRWPDWKDRQVELLDKADFFDFSRCYGAAEWLRMLAEKLPSETSRHMFTKFLNETLVSWRSDFIGTDQLRRTKVDSILGIILSAFAKGTFDEHIQTVIKILRDLEQNLENLMPLAKAFHPFRTKQDQKMRFYGMCYHYPLFVEGVFFKNVLERDFGVPPDWVDDCMQLLNENGKFAGIVRSVSGSPHVILGDLSQVETASLGEGVEAAKLEPFGEAGHTPPPPGGTASQIPKQIFVAHGKNKKPVDQLEKILIKFKVPHKIAIEEPNSGRPVGGKVADLMKECTSGIFIFTADEETEDHQGQKVWRPSDNVVYELGAASVLYGKKIVIFKETGVDFASDFGEISYIPFEKDRLDTKAAELMLELITLGFVQLTPT